MTEEETKVTVGDRVIDVGAISSFKVLRAGTSLGRITKLVGGISDEIQKFIADYREANKEVVSPALWEFRASTQLVQLRSAIRQQVLEENPSWEEEHIEHEVEQRIGDPVKISPEAWAASDNEIVIRRSPNGLEVAAFILPQVMEQAEEEVSKLLALLLSPDSELRDKKREGTQAYTDYLEEQGENLLFETQPDELIEIATVAATVLQDKMSGKLGRLQTAVSKLTGLRATQESPEETDGERSSSTSSTDSPSPTAGTPTSPSGPSGTQPQPSSIA